jgi:hypothetical protein
MSVRGSVVGVALLTLAACSPSPSPSPVSLSMAIPMEIPGPPPDLAPAGPPRPPPLDRAIRVLVAGDALPHRPSLVEPSAIEAALAPMHPLFEGADAVVVNYETATGEAPSSRLAYAADPEWLSALRRAGVTAVTGANNHACDLGERGLGATSDAGKRAGVPVVGVDARDPWAPKTIAEVGGKRVCAVAWTTISNSSSCARSRALAIAPTTRAGKRKIDRALRTARARCDAVVAIVHGGEEYKPQTTHVMDQAGHAAEVGADAVVIHHPHIPSPLVVHRTKSGRDVPIFASVGNLATNQGESWTPAMFPVLRGNRRLVCVNGWTRLGVVAELAFSFESGAPQVAYGTHLIWIDNEHALDKEKPVPKIQARPLDPSGDEAIIGRLREDVRGPVALFDDPCWIAKSGSSCRGALGPRK